MPAPRLQSSASCVSASSGTSANNEDPLLPPTLPPSPLAVLLRSNTQDAKAVTVPNPMQGGVVASSMNVVGHPAAASTAVVAAAATAEENEDPSLWLGGMCTPSSPLDWHDALESGPDPVFVEDRARGITVLRAVPRMSPVKRRGTDEGESKREQQQDGEEEEGGGEAVAKGAHATAAPAARPILLCDQLDQPSEPVSIW